MGVKQVVGDFAQVLAQKEEQKSQFKIMAETRKLEKVSAKTMQAVSPFSVMDIRVGRIASAVLQGSLLCFKVDVGAEQPIDVVSGIGAYYTPESVLERRVLVVMNLEPFKPKALPNFTSSGMLLTAKDESGKVELVLPPPSASIGAHAVLEASSAPTEAYARATDKQWAKVKKGLETALFILKFDGVPIVVGDQACRTEVVENASVS